MAKIGQNSWNLIQKSSILTSTIGPSLSIFEELSPFKMFSNWLLKNYWNYTKYKELYKHAIPADENVKLYSYNQPTRLQSCAKFERRTIPFKIFVII